MNKLSSLAQELFNQLSTISHITDPALGALTLACDPTVNITHRKAYAEIYHYLSNDLY